jgi:NAD(P)-dependent dehydrogenase (short-subunit alcohol dehydrogenase family)
MDIQQKTILVSGGGSGLGQATAERLHDEGANVVIIDVDQTKGATVAQTLGAQALFIAADVTDEASVQKAIAQAQAHFGALHGAVNCAGIAIGERITGKRGPHRLDTFAKVINVNLIGSFNVLRLAAAAMSQNEPGPDGERGVIVNTASVAAFDGQIGQVAYAASKGGIVGLCF